MSVPTPVQAPSHAGFFESEREDARTLQRSFLPERSLIAPSFEIAHEFCAVARVGGDFLDYFWLPDGRVGIYVGDVVGKGLAAAFYAALVVGTLRGVHKTGTPPASVLDVANERLAVRRIPGRYCAAYYSVFDPATMELRYANAGLPLSLHVSSTRCHPLGEGGLPLGMFPDSRYRESSVRLNPGEAVLIATDGLYESRNFRQEEFGVDRLGAVCRQSAGKSARNILDDIFDEVSSFSRGAHQHDDVAAVVLKMT